MRNRELSKLVSVAGRILLAFLFVFSQNAWAGQDEKTKDKTDSAQKPQEKQIPAALAKAQGEEVQSANAEESSVAGKKSSARGAHEGITVHGHWTIEVRNPDGSVVRHVEFENSLDPGFSLPNPTAGQPPIVEPGGAAYLSGVLSGQWSAPVVPTSALPQNYWMIWLVGAAGLNNVATTTNAPCVASIVGDTMGACLIVPAASCLPNLPPPSGWSCSLSVTALGTSPAFTGIQLTGSAPATQNGQVSTVATVIGLTCQASFPNCVPPNTHLGSLTSSTNFPGAPIAVLAGQTIAVTVNISFS